jgi:hypothetical protein
VESVIGTAVPANRQMPSFKSAGWQEGKVDEYVSQGDLVDAVTVLSKDWSGFKFDGAGTYSELTYVFGSGLCKPQGGAGQWDYYPQINKRDTPLSFTVEHGQDDSCGKSSGVIIDGFTLDWTRDEIKASGTGFGMLYSDDATPTSNPTEVSANPLAANQTGIFVDETYGNIGSTKLADCYHWALTLSKRWGMKWVMDYTLNSWQTYVVLLPSLELTIQLERNDQSKAFLDKMRTNSTRYLSVFAAAPTGSDSLSIQMPFRVIKNAGEPKDHEGVYTQEWTIKPVRDAAFLAANQNAFMHVSLSNELSAL